jgi:hypothetical protein
MDAGDFRPPRERVAKQRVDAVAGIRRDAISRLAIIDSG